MSRHRFIGRRNVLFRSNRCSYFSIVVMVVSNYGVFATSFTEETCQKYYFVSPVFKGVCPIWRLPIRTLLTTP
jgi:hypothetical protein